MKESYERWILGYFSGVGFSVAIAVFAVITNYLSTQILAMGYSIPFFVPAIFPFKMYLTNTFLVIFLVGPPLWMITTYLIQKFHIYPHESF